MDFAEGECWWGNPVAREGTERKVAGMEKRKPNL